VYVPSFVIEAQEGKPAPCVTPDLVDLPFTLIGNLYRSSFGTVVLLATKGPERTGGS